MPSTKFSGYQANNSKFFPEVEQSLGKLLVFLVFKNRCENWARVSVHETADGCGPHGILNTAYNFVQIWQNSFTTTFFPETKTVFWQLRDIKSLHYEPVDARVGFITCGFSHLWIKRFCH